MSLMDAMLLDPADLDVWVAVRNDGVIGSGTVSNRDPAAGSACLAERRMIEIIRGGKPVTPFMAVGDRIRIEADVAGTSPFGAIDQCVVGAAHPGAQPSGAQP